jgi:tetratricopeptide (TPR) repeat protein
VTREQPFISQDVVRAALDALLYTASGREASALDYLLLVDEFLINPDLPTSDQQREFATNTLLVGLITENLNAHLQGLSLPLCEGDETVFELGNRLVEASQSDNVELMGWFILYCRYVRVDLAIGPEQIEDLTHVEGRTIRRYQRHGVRRLTEHLIEREWIARTGRRKRRLFSLLPSSQPLPLFGRESELNYLEQQIVQRPASRVFISGAAGIGKTSFVQEFLRRQIDLDRLDEIIWLASAPSLAYVRQYLQQRLTVSHTAIDLREYFLLYAVTIVIDELPLPYDITDLDAFLSEMSGAAVYILHSIYQPLEHIDFQVHLREISREAAVEMAHSLVLQEQPATTGTEADYSVISVLYEQVGGNPLALKLSMKNLHVERFEAVTTKTLSHLFGTLLTAASHDQRSLWLKIALLPPSEIQPEQVELLWPSARENNANFSWLAQRYLLQKTHITSDVFMMPDAVRNFVQSQYHESTEIRQHIHELVKPLEERPLNIVYPVVEYLLLTSWLDLSQQQYISWLHQVYREGLRRGHYSQWRTIFEKFLPPDDLEMTLAYGVCLRQLMDWSGAKALFEAVARTAGQRGLFELQASAVIELATIFRHLGEYDKASNLLFRIESHVARWQNDSLWQAFRLEQAQVALDQGQYIELQHFLTGLPESRRKAAIQSEIYLALSDLDNAYQTAQKALELVEKNPGAEARIHALLGRIYEKLGEYHQARQHTAIALTMTEQQNDLFALARIQSNLGALLMREKLKPEAYELLKQAEELQLRIKDRAGLAVTRHNLRMLDRDN